MAYDYDVLVIGLGPAGMAVSIMASEMGLSVCAIEKHLVGGECMNVGCIPSKALLRIAKTRALFGKLAQYELADTPAPEVKKPFARIAEHLRVISDKKTMGMFSKVALVYQQGAASFVDAHTVAVGEKRYSARRIFICTGTRPEVPDIPGLADTEFLTNDTMFQLDAVPPSLIVVGGGAIACEMAQAFARLGSTVTMLIRGPRLMWREHPGATDLLEQALEADGVTILRDHKPVAVVKAADGSTTVTTDKGKAVVADKLLIAAGRSFDYTALKPGNAGIAMTDKGTFRVDRYLRTSQRHIYACGDCNGFMLFSHAAMHQGMIALMNCMLPWPFKRDFRAYPVPWTVFTEPQISHVGPRESWLEERNIPFEAVEVRHADYGAAIAEEVPEGFVRALVGPRGKILAATIAGEGSGEMINEWALAIQKGLRIHEIMMTQHSFPTMGFLSKRVGETWMMRRMGSHFLRRVCGFLYRLGT